MKDKQIPTWVAMLLGVALMGLALALPELLTTAHGQDPNVDTPGAVRRPAGTTTGAAPQRHFGLDPIGQRMIEAKIDNLDQQAQLDLLHRQVAQLQRVVFNLPPPQPFWGAAGPPWGNDRAKGLPDGDGPPVPDPVRNAAGEWREFDGGPLVGNGSWFQYEADGTILRYGG